jgi:hypothetical protein
MSGAYTSTTLSPLTIAARTRWSARVRVLVPVVLTLALGHASNARAQSSGTWLDAGAGWVGFADDGIVSEGMVSGAVRWGLGQRLSVGPEVVFIAGQHHHHLIATGNVVIDLVRRNGNAPPVVAPFVVAGAGLYRTSHDFPGGTYTSTEGAFTAGGGVRVRTGDRVTIGVDARIGWETHVRVNGVVGVRLGP